jgi:hypothetical protein
MLGTKSLVEACHRLFATYPLAVKSANRNGTIQTMVLMLGDGDNVKYFMLSHDRRDSRPPYSLRPWRATEAVDISVSDGIALPDVVLNALTHGVPIPRHGSLFGWVYQKSITTIIPVYTTYTPTNPDPSWTAMPRAGVSEGEWPPFTNECFFGSWFWQYYRAGSIVSLSSLIAATPETVFWVDTRTLLGSECCAVARDAPSSDGYILPRGCYVHYEVLQAGEPLPSLDRLLAYDRKTDLTTRFRMPDESVCS